MVCPAPAKLCKLSVTLRRQHRECMVYGLVMLDWSLAPPDPIS